jgi:uncharacterized membrane protein SpoIIM required for sporulation
MKVSDLLEARAANWQELETLCKPAPPQRLTAESQVRFARLYRAVCADLALADAYQLPPETIDYLHELVGRAHNRLYRSRKFQFDRWGHELFVVLPRRLFHDGYLRLAFCLFWGVFLLSVVLARRSPQFAEDVVTSEQLREFEEMYTDVPNGRDADTSAGMAGFYVYNNPGIGLRCFAFGLAFGVGGLFALVFNAAMLGAMFGHMSTVSQWNNFSTFVTAHGPFELTAIVLSAAAGMRLGFALVNTGGRARVAALRLAAGEAMPVMAGAVLLFLMAALIEAFLSPSSAPYAVKAGVAIVSALLLLSYYFVLGSRAAASGAEPSNLNIL